MSKLPSDLISIGEVVKATGVSESTLRVWERRYGFPQPRRETSGHRRYSVEQVEQIRRVVRDREQGTSLRVAIDRSAAERTAATSLFATLRDRHPELTPLAIRKRQMNLLASALEDESASRAEPGILIGAFQHEGFYRQSESRWRELGKRNAVAFVFADFERRAEPRGGPAEIPIDLTEPIAAEWGVICIGPGHGACLVGWEPPGREASRDEVRDFEALLSVEPAVVRTAAETAATIAEAEAPGVSRKARAMLEKLVDASPETQLRLSSAITTRVLAGMN